MSDLLKIEKLGKSFKNRVLFSGFNFTFPSSGFFSIVGESGSGKSTLLEMISGLDNEYEGKIFFRGKLLKKQSEKELTNYRLKHIGFVRQHYELLELEKVLENVSLPLLATSSENPSKISRRCFDLLSSLSLKKRSKAKSKNLSGGEKQRVALARSISSNKKILLCDEPTGALDSKNAEKVYHYLRSISKDVLVIMVTHDVEKAKEFSDGLFVLANKRIIYQKNVICDTEEKKIIALRVKNNKEKMELPNRFLCKHSFHLLVAKSRRSFLTIGILTVSLFSLGVASFLSFDASKEINNAFSSLIGKSQIVMEKEGDSNNIDEAISATEEEVVSIINENPGLANDYGISYFTDFTAYFKDLDVVYALSESFKVELASFNASLPNDYLLLEDEDAFVYPSRPDFIEDDQIILGLPYKNMAQLCFGFQIIRDYETLGAYLEEFEVDVLFELANEEWKYEDSQIFKLVGVVQTDVPLIYHTNRHWNGYFYEERLRLPTNDGSPSEYPFVIQKIFYLRDYLSDDEFYKKVRKNEMLASYVFEKANHDYSSIICKPYEQCYLERYYVYLAKKNSIPIKTIEDIKNKYEINSYSVIGEMTYRSFPSSLMAGFIYPFYSSSSLEELQKVVETRSVVPIEQCEASIDLPDNVVEGSYKLPFSKGLTISNKVDSLLEGRMAKKINEVVISKKLADLWGYPKNIYVAGEVNEENYGTTLERDYRYGSLEVVGIAEANECIFFVEPYWSIDYFASELGMSSFYLEPNQVIFEIDDSVKSEDLIPILKKEYPSYKFSDPTTSISNSTENVLNFVKIALFFASIGSLSISFLLLLVVGILFANEGKKEGCLLFRLGISRNDISKIYLFNLGIPVLLASLISSVFVAASEYLIHQMLCESFSGGTMSFTFSFLPIAIVFMTGCIAFFLIGCFLKNRAEKETFRRENVG